MNETPTESIAPAPTPAHVCTCCGGEKERRKPGAKARSESNEWRRPFVLDRVKEIGRRLRYLRERMDLTQRQTAQAALTSLASVQHVEAGIPKDLCYPLIIADALACPPSKLFVSVPSWDKFVAEKISLFQMRAKEIRNQYREQP